MPEWTADIEVDAERAAAWIARRFPDLAGLPLIPAGEGWDNVLFRVGPELVFRIPRRKLGAELMGFELAVLPHLAPHLPLQIPAPILRAEPGEDTPYPFAGYRWIEGTTADRAGLSDAERRKMAPVLGRFLRALHACDPGEEAEAVDPGDALRRADLPYRLPALLERLDALVWPGVDREGIREELGRLAHTEPWEGEPVWVHGDLYGRHLVVKERALVGVIDWGDCHRGDPALDLCVAIGFLPPDAWTDFRVAYGGVDEATWDRARYRALHYGVNLLRYGLAVDDAEMVAMGRRALVQGMVRVDPAAQTLDR